MKFFDRLEAISNRIDEVIWQAGRFIRTGDCFSLYVITGIERFRNLSTMSIMIAVARAQGRNHSMGIEWMKLHAAYADELVGLYNSRKFFWMVRK